nr:hypothetical protein Iba_chr13eCG7150 [Ipomoea batatas]
MKKEVHELLKAGRPASVRVAGKSLKNRRNTVAGGGWRCDLTQTEVRSAVAGGATCERQRCGRRWLRAEGRWLAAGGATGGGWRCDLTQTEVRSAVAGGATCERQRCGRRWLAAGGGWRNSEGATGGGWRWGV